jgi:3-hydroxy-9,10-secoandrosta-1,3,5(10)-triene-9,17-dione monooxygenase
LLDVAETMRASETREALLRSARELVPRLKQRVDEAAKIRRVPDETIREFHEAGLFRALQPARVGGGEGDYGLLVELGAVLAHGCASSAWTLTNLASHHWMLAMFPPEAQDEIWGADPAALISASFIFPAGRAHAVEGGYVLSGRWPFCSGIELCGWTMLGAIVGGEFEEDPAEYRIFLLPRDSYRIIDTWRAGGLEATGSHDTEVDQVFVPAHHTLAVDDIKGGNTPGSAVNPGSVYRIPVFATFPYVLSGTVLGLAEATVKAFMETAGRRIATYTAVPLSDFPAVQRRIAEAAALADAAKLVMTANCAEVQRLAEADRVPDMLSKVRYRRDGAFSAGLCSRAVDLLYEAGGGGAVYLHHPLQRAFRDMHAARAHITFNMDVAGTAYGRVALGQPADNPTL